MTPYYATLCYTMLWGAMLYVVLYYARCFAVPCLCCAQYAMLCAMLCSVLCYSMCFAILCALLCYSLCFAVLFHVLCYSMLCSVLCYSMLCSVLCFAVCYAVLCYASLCCALRCPMRRCAVLHAMLCCYTRINHIARNGIWSVFRYDEQTKLQQDHEAVLQSIREKLAECQQWQRQHEVGAEKGG